MIKNKIKIDKIDIIENLFIIKSNNNKTFYSKIIKGSVNFKLYNELNQEMNLNNIDSGDIIKIFGKKDKENNNIIINKIIVKNKYFFNSDSDSESINDLYYQ
jgi:hypothetical protein